MAFDTVRTNKMRSALTVLGVVIGITSIVGMTAMIRGFDQSLRDMIRAIGPNTIFVQRFGVTSFASGAEFRDLLKRPNLTISDARALEEQADDDPARRHRARRGGRPADAAPRVLPRPEDTKPLIVFGTAENFAEGTRIPILGRPLLQRHRSAVPQERRACSATRPYQLLFEPTGTDPIGKSGARRHRAFEVVGVFDKRPAAGGFNLGQDDFVVIPYTAYQRIFGLHAVARRRAMRHVHANPDRRRAARRRHRRRTPSPTSSA